MEQDDTVAKPVKADSQGKDSLTTQEGARGEEGEEEEEEEEGSSDESSESESEEEEQELTAYEKAEQRIEVYTYNCSNLLTKEPPLINGKPFHYPRFCD